jgi:hypothetical protein
MALTDLRLKQKNPEETAAVSAGLRSQQGCNRRLDDAEDKKLLDMIPSWVKRLPRCRASQRAVRYRGGV